MLRIIRKRSANIDEAIDINDVILKREELIEHARLLSKIHKIESNVESTKALHRNLDYSYARIQDIYKRLNRISKDNEELSPASEWLLDNFYKIEEQFKDVIQSIKKDRFVRLPILTNGYLKGYPRIYAIALELISHTDGKVEEDVLIEFVKSYQSFQILSIAEIWSLSLMISIALIENIRVICEKVFSTQLQWSKAAKTLYKDIDEIREEIDKNIELKGLVNSSYIERILFKIRREEMDLSEILDYLELRLYEYNTSMKKTIQNEHKEHAARKISIGNSISSLHNISRLNWNNTFESISIIDERLRKDPSGSYSKMDFESRDYYRRVIEDISKFSNLSEIKIVNKALELSKIAKEKGRQEKEFNIGYYLIERGRADLLESLNINKDYYRLESIKLYISFISILTLFIVSVLLLSTQDIFNILSLLVFALITLLPALDMAIHFSNSVFAEFFPPKRLVRLELKDGIPDEAATLVIIPTLLVDLASVKEIIDRIEVYYLANKDENLYFSLVADFKDADEETKDIDMDIIEEARNAIKNLNEKYSEYGEIFYYFHRKRIYNKKQDKYMGWERKRGAIIELNNFLMGCESTSFIEGTKCKIREKDIKYVITIDSDTRLIMDSAKRLIGTIYHPLNKAIYDEEKKVVLEGYGIIQPRIVLDIKDTNRTFFSKTFSYSGGIDPYSTAVSDTYQDVFGEAIFTGKGIYDLGLFNKVMEDKIEEATILSHDLLEGSLLRTGLAYDIELIDGYPSKYSAYIARLHRWTRGDWQLIKWLFESEFLSPLSRWKMFDNLRRSLLYPSLFIFILISASVLHISLLSSMLIVALTLFFPTFISMVHLFFSGYKHITGCIEVIKKGIYQTLIQIVFLPYNTGMMLDAIIRTLYRVFISKKFLLEWVTAADIEKRLSNSLKDNFIRMRIVYFFILIFNIIVFAFCPADVFISLIFTIVWIASPYIAYKISEEKDVSLPVYSKKDIENLKRISRKTWCFYEDLIKDEYNYLPPDNYQEYPYKGSACRTSPTNIGLYLVSALAARDQGYITTTNLVDRLDNTMDTVLKMESWKGHLYNWYNINTLEVLRPFYVSTVDSGNFATYLLLLRQGLMEYLEKPLIGDELIEGISDTFSIYDDIPFAFKIANKEYESSKEVRFIAIMNFIDRLYQTREKEFKKQKKAINIIEEIRGNFNKYFLSMMTIKTLEMSLGEENENEIIDEYLRKLMEIPSLTEMEEIYEDMKRLITQSLSNAEDGSKEQLRLIMVKENVSKVLLSTSILIERINNIVEGIDGEISNMEFKHLYNKDRKFFSIGYDVEKEKLTNSYYDLLASEARTASFWAIVNKEVPKEHWYKLGRTLTRINNSRALVSWTGTMFEYFMPALIFRSIEATILNETFGVVLKAQKSYGKKQGIPWGTSESGFYSFDFNLNYQYKAFGIPDLGLKRGLIDDIVISSYSTFLCLNFDPQGSIKNLNHLLSLGMEGVYGLYEAIDFTPKRLGKRKEGQIIQSFMAHHQGMTMLSLCNFFKKDLMIKRFHSHPLIKAGEFLLEEKIPSKVIITKEFKDKIEDGDDLTREFKEARREYGTVNLLPPPCHIITNGNFSVLMNNRGGGFSKYNDVLINRWRDDLLKEDYGSFIFIKNMSSDEVWSSVYDFNKSIPDGYKVIFSPSRAEFFRCDDEITTAMEIFISPEDDVEIRRIRIENHGIEEVLFEITSFMELTLSREQDDIAHRAFNNLFIRTEFLEEHEALIANRRPRERFEDERWVFHSFVSCNDILGPIQYETSRENFIGRGRNIHNPVAHEQSLTNTAGIVLDPSMSLRKLIKIKGESAETISFITGYAKNRKEILDLCEKYKEQSYIERAYELSIIRSQVESSYLSLTFNEIVFYDSLISHLIYLNTEKKAEKNIMNNIKKNQSDLWAYGISGDLPIILVSIKEEHEIPLLRQGLKAHEYLKMKGLKVDLIVLNEDESNYLQPLRQLINDIVETSSGRYLIGGDGGIHIKNASNMPLEDIRFMYAISKIILKTSINKTYKDVIRPKLGLSILEKESGLWDFNEAINSQKQIDETYKMKELLFFNEYGGFNKEGNKYIIGLDGKNTPAPWINVIANKQFGFTISERGGGYSWAENSRENKLTPWNNDPVVDEAHELVYIKDIDSKKIWTITPAFSSDKSFSKVIHAWGYTIFQRTLDDIVHDMTVFVPKEDAIKISLIKLKNNSEHKKTLQLYYYLDLVLGVHEHFTKHHLSTYYDKDKEMLLVSNNYSYDFHARKVFISSSEEIKSYSGDRHEFLGIGGDKESPISLLDNRLKNTLGAGNDACGVIQIEIELEAKEEKMFSFYHGQVKNQDELFDYKLKYFSLDNCLESLEEVKSFWNKTTSTIKIKTPDPSMDLMMNGWLVYQTLACRLWARSAFYQSGGAFGFRDQLQDAINIKVISPELLKEQILLHSRHQFKEGDVQHWWHPNSGDKGVRTRFSDDLLWLPYAVIEYINDTEDYSILKIEERFLEDQLLKKDEDERYSIPWISDEKASIYEHCIRAIERSLKVGVNGLTLMGSGDWNDGMNAVGNKGKGESVWLSFFLYNILLKFIPSCIFMGDNDRAEVFLNKSKELKDAIEENAWDGNWYKRAFYDDGTPLGSSENKECMIDSIAQSWAVLSNAASRERCELAMESVKKHLVKEEEGIIKLFTPPFDKTEKDPGYIKSYVTGVRENGGQYTHAASWVICAFASLGQGDMASKLFNMLNPINYTRTITECNKYKTEPYVLAADVYAVSPHVGRGGWTWYTGAAGWLFRAGLEFILGFKKKRGRLFIEPCIPNYWKEYELTYKYYNTEYHFHIKNPDAISKGVNSMLMDGEDCSIDGIRLKDDKKRHEIIVIMGNGK